MAHTLRYDQEATLFAVCYAAKRSGSKCVNPQQVSDFLLPEARTGNIELFEKCVKVANELVALGYLETCTPTVQITGYGGYQPMDKGTNHARTL
jgi:hypothetical protein